MFAADPARRPVAHRRLAALGLGEVVVGGTVEPDSSRRQGGTPRRRRGGPRRRSARTRRPSAHGAALRRRRGGGCSTTARSSPSPPWRRLSGTWQPQDMEWAMGGPDPVLVSPAHHPSSAGQREATSRRDGSRGPRVAWARRGPVHIADGRGCSPATCWSHRYHATGPAMRRPRAVTGRRGHLPAAIVRGSSAAGGRRPVGTVALRAASGDARLHRSVFAGDRRPGRCARPSSAGGATPRPSRDRLTDGWRPPRCTRRAFPARELGEPWHPLT